MKRLFFKTIEADANQGVAMEPVNHLKTGASSKSLTNRGNSFRKIWLALLTAGIIFSGCEDKDANIRVTDVDLDSFKTTIEVDETVTVTGKVTPANHTAEKFTLTSSDDDIATVTGMIQGANVMIIVKGISPGTALIDISTDEGVKLISEEITVVEKGEGGNKPVSVVTIGENGNWFIDGVDTGFQAVAIPGLHGSIPEIGENGNWWIEGIDTGMPAKCNNCAIPEIGENGNWWIDGIDTGKTAQVIPNPINTFIVTFNPGNGSPLLTQIVIGGGWAMAPTNNPERTNYIFGGWYTEADEKYIFEKPVADNITLYAKWIEDNGTDCLCPDGSVMETSAFDGAIVALEVAGNEDSYYSGASMVAAYTLDIYDNFPDFAYGSYANGGFTLTLPQTMESIFLRNDNFKTEWEISDKNALIAGVEGFDLLDSDGKFIDELYHGKFDQIQTYNVFVSYLYADRDVKITGDSPTVYSCLFLKKGWNAVYITEDKTTHKETWTTKAISGVKWYFRNHIVWQ